MFRAKTLRTLILPATLLVFAFSSETLAPVAHAQLPPGIGYMFPPSGRAGETVEVTLGGYDWTPDMQLVLRDPRIKLELLGPPGPVIVPEPPYWFGAKARRPPFLLPREFQARLTIPADVEPGIYEYQAANANGATPIGKFVVGDLPETMEHDGRSEPQRLESLPISVNGQIKKIEEVDQYEFVAPNSGPITCEVMAKRLGSDLNAILEIRDAQGILIADTADTSGVDAVLTFAAQAGQHYTASIYDVDFRGDRSLTYRFTVAAAPRVIAAIPAAGQRGVTQTVEFVGYGIATGQAKLESVMREVDFPAGPQLSVLRYKLETPFGTAAAFSIPLSDSPQTLKDAVNAALSPEISPVEITGVLAEQYAEDAYRLSGAKGDRWNIAVSAARIGSPLDVTVAIRNAEGVEVARADDLLDSTDAQLWFTVPADGEYTVVVSDVSGSSGNRAAVYHLACRPALHEFTLQTPEMLPAPIGGTGKLALKITRSPGFQEPIAISLRGLPAGVSVPDDLSIPKGKVALNIDLPVAADTAAWANLVTVVGEAVQDEQPVSASSAPILLATTITPPFALDAEGKDDVLKWPRGTTFPGPVLIERNEGFTADIVLEMSSKQGRHRMGISGPEVTVPNGPTRVIYPVYLPEWLETTRTSRMVVNGVAKVTDPKGNVRYSLTKQKSRMGFLPTGALLKLASSIEEFSVQPGQRIDVPLSVSRSAQLEGPLQLELRLGGEEVSCPVSGDSFTMAPSQLQAQFPLMVDANLSPGTEHLVTIRATAMQAGNLPVVSETSILLIVQEPRAAP